MRTAALAVSFVCCAPMLFAEDPPRVQAEIGASLIQTTGNSSALSAGGHAFLKFNAKPYSVSLEGSYLRVDGDQAARNEKADAALQLERRIGNLFAPYLE